MSSMRATPVPTWVKLAVDNWLTASGVSTGPVFRAINKAQADRDKRFQSESHMGRRKGGVREMWAVSRCRTISAEPVPDCVMRQAESLSEQIQFLLGPSA